VTAAAQGSVAYQVLGPGGVVGEFAIHEDAWFMAEWWNRAYPPPDFPEYVLDPATCADERCVCRA
jgi:hypothetical protein